MKLSPKEIQERLQDKEQPVCLIDVRSPDEFASGHVPGARCVPLENLETEFQSVPKDDWILVACQSGRRSQAAADRLRGMGFLHVAQLEGGFQAWSQAGLPVHRTRTSRISVQRQVMTVAGALVLLGLLLGMGIHPAFLAISAFVSLGLIQAGFTGWCGMALLLEKMPWNRS
ncbi:MAG: rhodanese-like domain-containing protein [bacterium]